MAALLIGIGIGSASSGSSKKTVATATPTVTVTQSANPAVTVTQLAKPAVRVTATVTAESTATVTTTATVTAPPAAPPSAAQAGTTVPGDGSYIVGTDIQPGTYQTKGPASSAIPNCYWERDSSASGDLGSIIANDNTAGSATVTVQATDKLFKTSGCQDWTKVG